MTDKSLSQTWHWIGNWKDIIYRSTFRTWWRRVTTNHKSLCSHSAWILPVQCSPVCQPSSTPEQRQTVSNKLLQVQSPARHADDSLWYAALSSQYYSKYFPFLCTRPIYLESFQVKPGFWKADFYELLKQDFPQPLSCPITDKASKTKLFRQH